MKIEFEQIELNWLSVSSIADGQKVLSVGEDHYMRVVDVGTGTEVFAKDTDQEEIRWNISSHVFTLLRRDLRFTHGATANLPNRLYTPMKYANCTLRVRTNILVGKMREHRAVLNTANGCVMHTRLRVCLVYNSMALANQQGLYACVNVISIFHENGPFNSQA